MGWGKGVERAHPDPPVLTQMSPPTLPPTMVTSAATWSASTTTGPRPSGPPPTV